MFRYSNPITPEVEDHLRALTREAAVITIAGPNGTRTISLNHFDACAVGYSPIGDGLNRRIAEAVQAVRVPLPKQVGA